MHNASPSIPGNYLYRIAIEDPNSKGAALVYIGQARSAHRALAHLGKSHNSRLADAMQRIKTWPDISASILPKRCLGDLEIGEDCLISIASDRTVPGDCCNAKSGRNSEWRLRGQAPSGRQEILRDVKDQGETWSLWSEEFCDQTNLRAVKTAAQSILRGRPLPERFLFLPPAGQPIVKINKTNLAQELGKLGHRATVVVHINDRESGERPPLGPWTDGSRLSERCLKFWPPSKKVSSDFIERTPTALVAVMGLGWFRTVIGAWSIHGVDLTTGVYSPTERLTSLEGLVVTDLEFTQARYPFWYVTTRTKAPAKTWAWAGHNG